MPCEQGWAIKKRNHNELEWLPDCLTVPVANLWQDLRHAFRALRRGPGLTAAAVILLALGIGANSAVFSVVHAVLLDPVPYRDPARLVQIQRRATHNNISLPEFQFWKQNAASYSSVAAAGPGVGDALLDAGSSFAWIKAGQVSDGYLETLGIEPALGREFTPDEARRGGPQALILSDGLWRRMFSADPNVLGRSVTMGRTRYTIVGILPQGLWLDFSPDALSPLQPSGTVGDTGANTMMIARLKPGISIQQAEREQADLTGRYLASLIDPPQDYRGLTTVSYTASLNTPEVRTNLLFLAGAAGLLLLIACSNLAGLLIARMASRSREFAVRLALGGSTARLLRQSLLENLLLSLVGGLAGLLAASWLIEGLRVLKPYALHTATALGVDPPVLWFTFAVSLITCVLFSIGPLFSASRTDISSNLKSVRQGSGGRAFGRGILVIGQVAFTVTLLVCATLLIQTLYRLHRQELGFSPQGLVTFHTPNSAVNGFETAMLDRLKTLPGVRGAAGANALPLVGFNNFPTQREGHPEQSIGAMEIRRISLGYFETMGTRLLNGRAFSAVDTAASQLVILVNETLARQWWGEGNPLGDNVVIGQFKGNYLGPKDASPSRRVVGIVADTRRRDLKEPPRATVYIPADQSVDGPGSGGGVNWVLRGNFAPGFAQRLRQAVAEVDPRLRVDLIRTMDDVIASSTAASRFDAWLFGIFAGVALLLTIAGIYGLLAFSVARRTYEIGTRMALGASRAHVIAMILRQSGMLVAIGLAAGMAAGAEAARSLGDLLFSVRPADPPNYILVALVLLASGLLAAFLPARRAASVDPMVALRSE